MSLSRACVGDFLLAKGVVRFLVATGIFLGLTTGMFLGIRSDILSKYSAFANLNSDFELHLSFLCRFNIF